jgi:hypothetical protein
MSVDGVRSAGTGTQQTATTSFQAKDLLQGGSFKMDAAMTEAMNQRTDVYGKEMGEKYIKPAIEEAEKAITDWIKAHPNADEAATIDAVKKAMNDAIYKQQNRKIGDDHFMQQLVSKIGQAMKFNTDTWEG